MSKDETFFSDLNPIPIKYSKYAVSLDKVFKNQSLESLHYNLKHPRAFKIKDFNFDKGEPPQQNNLYKFVYLIFSAEKFNILPDINSYGRNSGNEQHLAIGYSFNPQTSMKRDKLKEIIKSAEKWLEKINGVVSWKKKDVNKIMKKREQQMNSNIKNFNKNITVNQKDLDSSIVSKNNRNSAFRFSQYLERKTSFKLNVLPVISYINPNEDLKKNRVPDFSKMQKREDKLIRHGNNPSVCYYEPNYDVITRSPARTIKFNGISKDKKRNIKKIFCSYDVPRNFLTVDIDLAQRREEGEEDFLLGSKNN